MFHDLTGGVDAEVYGIIIVDDELFVRKGLIGMIDWEGSGFRIVDEADNGEDALELIRVKRPQARNHRYPHAGPGWHRAD